MGKNKVNLPSRLQEIVGELLVDYKLYSLSSRDQNGNDQTQYRGVMQGKGLRIALGSRRNFQRLRGQSYSIVQDSCSPEEASVTFLHIIQYMPH